MRAYATLALLVGLAQGAAACGGGPAPPAPRPALAYRLPEPPEAGYRMADTVRVEIQAMGQSFAVEGGALSDWRMAFATDPGGVRVTATLLDLDARMSNPLGPGQTVDESEVTGPVVFVLDPQGNSTLASAPTLEGAAQFFTGSTIANGFFPRLPGRPTIPGDSWVDTVSYSASESGAETSVRTVWTYTAAGDTTVGSAVYQVVRAAGETEQTSGGTIAGTDFTQSVSGPVTGRFLWDVSAGILHSSEHSSDLSGTTELSIAPVPLNVRVRSVVLISRAPSP